MVGFIFGTVLIYLFCLQKGDLKFIFFAEGNRSQQGLCKNGISESTGPTYGEAGRGKKATMLSPSGPQKKHKKEGQPLHIQLLTLILLLFFNCFLSCC